MTSTDVDRPLPEVGDLAEAPIFDAVDERKLALIQGTVAKNATREEVGAFLQLAAKYELDPFAHEIWCAKGKGKDGGTGRLLIMVGRDGLRKIAQRNGIHVDGDVVHQHDRFDVVRSSDGNRTVEHAWGRPEDRGPIIGAWAECREGGPLGKPLGFFYAAISEYKPTSEGMLKYSPWGTQESVMILAAAERQALRQATPLSGLLVEGEGEINNERALGEGAAPESRATLLDAIIDNIPIAQQDQAKDLIDEMNSLAPNSWSASKVEMIFKGKSAYNASVELTQIEKAIEELRERHALTPAEDIVEADVVEEDHRQPLAAETWECPQCHRELLSGDEACSGKLSEKDHPSNVQAVQVRREEPNSSDSADLQNEDAPSPEALEKVAVLRSREDELAERYATADGREEEELGIELEQVRQAIRDLGATPTVDTEDGRVDQGSLPL